MTSYSTMALNGRIEAARTAHQPVRAITAYRWHEEVTMVGRWHEPAPPFTTERTYRQHPDGTHWEVDVVLACGHTLQRIAYGITGDGHVPERFRYRYAIGKRKRCTTCPPVEPKPAPPDEVRCTYIITGEETEERRCRTRARWAVHHITGAGIRGDDPVDRVCEKHRRTMIEWGGILPEPRPHPHGYTDGGWDVVEKIPTPRST